MQLTRLHIMHKSQGMPHFVECKIHQALLYQLPLDGFAGLVHHEGGVPQEVVQVQIVARRAEQPMGSGRAAFHRRLKQPVVLEAVGEEDPLQHDIGANDLPRAGVDETGSVAAKWGLGGGGPAEDIVTDVAGIPPGIVGLDLDLNGVLEAGGLKGGVPGQYAPGDGIAKLMGRGIFQPPDDGLPGFGERCGGVGLLQVPAVDQIAVGGGAGGGHVGDPACEVAHPGVIDAGLVAVLRQCDETVLDLDTDGSGIGNAGAAPVHRCCIIVNVLHYNIGVLGVAANAHDLGLVLVHFPQLEFFCGVFIIRIGRRLQLQHVFRKKQSVRFDEVFPVLLLGDDLAGDHDGRADIGFRGPAQGIIFVEIEGCIGGDQLDAVKIFAHHECLRPTVAAAKVSGFQDTVSDESEVNVLLVQLVLLDEQIGGAVVPVLVEGEQPREFFGVLGLVRNGGRLVLLIVFGLLPGGDPGQQEGDEQQNGQRLNDVPGCAAHGVTPYGCLNIPAGKHEINLWWT